MNEPTQTTRRRLLRGGPIRLVGQGSAMVVALVTTGLTLRHLGSSDAGLLYAGLAALTLASAFSEFGLGASAVRDYVNLEADDERRLFLGRLLGLRLALVAPAVAFTVLVGALAQGDSSPGTRGLVLGGVWILLLTLQSVVLVPLTAEVRSGVLASIQVVQSAAALAVTAALVVAEAPVELFFAVQVPGMVATVVVLALSSTTVVPRPKFSGLRHRLLSRATLTLGLATAVYIVFYRLGPLAVSVLGSREEAGIYAAAFRVLDVVESVAPLLLAVVLPALSERSDEPAVFTHRLRDVVLVMGVLGSFAGVALVAVGPLAIDALAGEGFTDAGPVLQVMAAGMVAFYLAQCLGYAMVARHAHAELLAGNAVGVVCSLALLVVLVPTYGAMGGAVALLCGQLALTVVYWVALARHHSLREVRGTMAAAVVASALGTAFAVTVPNSLLALVLACAACAIVFVVSGHLSPSSVRRLIKTR